MGKRLLALAIALWVCSQTLAFGFTPYENYTYGSDGQSYPEPQAYLPQSAIRGETLGAGALNAPSDLFTAPDGRIYVADTGNNRILVLTEELTLSHIIDGFERDGKKETFQNPQGLFVTGDNRLYVADTDNGRIVALTPEGTLLQVFAKPEIPIEANGYDYKPVRLSVDGAGRMFVVAKNINKGLLELDAQGNFVSYFGAIPVSYTFADMIWRRVLTRTQLAASTQLVPTEYSSTDIDNEGFVYGTIAASDDSRNFIRKINHMGDDILQRKGFAAPMGDVNTKDGGFSSLTDICVREGGLYSVLDSAKGRVFTYDFDGNLLYVFGAYGETLGALGAPAALDVLPDGRYLVLDSQYRQIVVYRPTQYAQMITEAVLCQYRRQFDEAEAKWQTVLKYTSYSDLAYVGMGRVLLKKGEYEEAMRYFKLGNDASQYSTAFIGYRKQVVDRYFSMAMTGLLLIVIAACVYWLWRKRRNQRI